MSEIERKPKTVYYPCQLATKVDWETVRELEDIAVYEKKKKATLVRDIILDKIRVYKRNPAYKRFKRDLELREERRKKE